MNKLTEKILTHDSFAESERAFGNKHWSEFTEDETSFSMAKFIIDNQIKEEHLKSITDTYFSIGWNEFKNLIKDHGFIPALEYDIHYTKWNSDKIEEAIIYYNLNKGLVIWATSFNGKTTLNEGDLYGEIQANSKEDCNTIWKWLSTGGCINQEKMIYETKHDVREGLFSKLQTLELAGSFLPKWTKKDKFLWFVDYMESDIEGYDYKAITKDKIARCPKEFQNIIG